MLHRGVDVRLNEAIWRNVIVYISVYYTHIRKYECETCVMWIHQRRQRACSDYALIMKLTDGSDFIPACNLNYLLKFSQMKLLLNRFSCNYFI